jgi:uncharacterized membrane protein
MVGRVRLFRRQARRFRQRYSAWILAPHPPGFRDWCLAQRRAALIECVGGIILYFVTAAAISSWPIHSPEELIEDPNDFHRVAFVADGQPFFRRKQGVLCLLSHGLVKVLLVVGL